MSLVATRDGVRQLLLTMLGASSPESMFVRLYVNNRRPKRDDTADDYDELTGHDYLAQRIEPKDWRVIHDRGGRVLLEAVALVWTFGVPPIEPETIYGYYVLGANTSTLYWAEALRIPITPRKVGERLRIIPRVELRART